MTNYVNKERKKYFVVQRKGKLEETSHRPNTFMQTYLFQVLYFSIGYEWEMEWEN